MSNSEKIDSIGQTIVKKYMNLVGDCFGAQQVITSLSSVVKELVENSLDAGSLNIKVQFVNYGSKLVVIDDGSGIADLAAIGKHRTSKITGFDDLTHCNSYGFRHCNLI